MNTFFRLLSLNAARILFVGGLLLALYAGLTWALSPDERPDAARIAEAQAALEQAASEEALEDASEEVTEPEATESAVPEPTEAPTTPSPAVLIAEAKDPADTTVQVLDAGGGSAKVDAAVAVLEQLGYDVRAISPSSRDVAQTTVYFTGDARPEAEALRAREPRFQTVEANQGLSEGVDIHVLVGPEF